MEEELNENDLEERLYAMIHHVDGTQAENVEPIQDASPRVEETPRSTLKRYWRTSHNSAYQKINTPKNTPPNKNTPANVNKNTPAIVNKTTPALVNTIHAAATKTTDTKPKAEKNDAPDSPPAALAILQNTQPQNYVKTIKILEIDEPGVVELESSDEDEVIEVALPPKPTITIESSDEEELIINDDKITKDKKNSNKSKENKSPNKNNRDVSASPVPSVVSTMSDDFIRGDCLALNISAAQPDNQTFDFSLHGSDLLEESTPSKKKKKKKSKDRLTSTPIVAESVKELATADNIFATPKSKAKNKKPKTKSYAVSEKIIPNADVYDSDSNQSVLDVTKNHDIVTETRFPSADVYESDSSVAESIKNIGKQPAPKSKINEIDSSDSNTSIELSEITTLSKNATDKSLVVDLTNDSTILDETEIEENIVIGNVSGYSDVNEYGDNSLIKTTSEKEIGEFCSTKVPQILFEDLDFDNLKGKDKVCRRRRYSLTTLRAEMEKFYNESWGGENFNHQEIQKKMSRDKSLWVIDPKDRMPNPPKRRVTCNYCNRIGHRDDTCERKPPVCHMCGSLGHYEPRCPSKICVNCGAPNFMYSTMCRNCAPWRQLTCAECGRHGHPSSHCPDTWRRYHNTIDENMPLEACAEKPYHQQQCSGCARRGHPAHACRAFLPLCALPVPHPAVARYCPVYTPARGPAAGKRRSKSPARHDTHLDKKRMSEEDNKQRNRNNSQSQDAAKTKESEAPPDFIPIATNRDKQGQIIQDNEVSDTSEVKTSARIYIEEVVLRKLQTPAGQEWMKRSMERFDVDVSVNDSTSFLTVVGTVGDQEAFQTELRSWQNEGKNDNGDDGGVCAMPKKKNDLLRTLNAAFDSLKADLGDPRAIYKELTYLRNKQETIKNLKVISPKQLNNNRTNINAMLKKLNMVLLGQAGLAGGAEDLLTLHSLKDRLNNIRNQKIPQTLRAEINQHYRTIFTPLARDDYTDLMAKFYSTMRPNPLAKSSQSKPKTKKKKKKAKAVKNKMQMFLGTSMLAENIETPGTVEYGGQQQKTVPISIKVKRLIKNLSWTHSLLRKQQGNAKFDKQRVNIARKVYSEIISLNESDGRPQLELLQNVKKALRVQGIAQGFLKQSQKRNGCATQRPDARAGQGQ